MKVILQGTHGETLFTCVLICVLTYVVETDSSPEQVSHLVNSMIQEDFLYTLAHSIHLLPFEARKDSQAIFSHVLRFRPSNSIQDDAPALGYVIDQRSEVVVELCRGYEHKESAMPCGVVLREILKNEHITAIVLHDQSQGNERAIKTVEVNVDALQSGDGIFWRFFSWIDTGAFEVSTDAFTTFRVSEDLPQDSPAILTSRVQEVLTRHKNLVSHYLSTNFDLFFKRYNSMLIGSSSYVTKRQSIKLLGEILLDRANYNVMTAYVDKGEHLKLCMNLLRDDRKMVQYEGFHVFKVSVDIRHSVYY